MRLRPYALRCLALLSFSAFFFSSCSTDLDPNAEYKEIMVLYSILNQTDTVHYAKVNKAFLNTNSNALTIAGSNPDSITYAEETLKVELQKLTIRNSDTTVAISYPMERFISTNKEGGTFAGPNQVLYRTQPNQPGPITDESAVYRIVATNLKSGLTASGATELVKRNDTPLNNPKRFSVYQVSAARSMYPPLDLIDTTSFDPERPNRVDFYGPENAYIYAMKVTFHFTETNGATTQNKQVSYFLRNNFIQQNPEVKFNVDDNFFYTSIMNLIDTSNDNAATFRKAGPVVFTITAGSKSLADNYRINNSFSVFSQVKPEWDNIKNGTGLIGARTQRILATKLSFPATTVLTNNPEYSKLKFR